MVNDSPPIDFLAGAVEAVEASPDPRGWRDARVAAPFARFCCASMRGMIVAAFAPRSSRLRSTPYG